MNINRLTGRVVLYKNKKLKHKQITYILSLIIGIIAGFSAVLLKNAVHFTHHFLLENIAIDKLNFLYLLFPMFGILITVLYVRYFVKDNIGHGISRILFAISKKNGKIKSHNNYSSLIASTLTVGFGGSVGLEAPIVLTGSSIGSTLGKWFRMNYKTKIILIGCGAAGAIAGIFKAPIAAVIFALEVLMLDLTTWSIIPLLISAVTSLTVSYFLLGRGEIFTFVLQDPFLMKNIPFYILLGIFTGLVSLYFSRTTLYIENQFKKINNAYSKALFGGAGLGLLVLLFPPLYGEGYKTLDSLLNGSAEEITYGSLFYDLHDNFWVFGAFLLLILVFKTVATSFTNGAGGVGGIFAPTLFMGGISGYFFGKMLNNSHMVHVSERNFSLVGMAGMMAGVMHAPLTAIFLIAEITGGYGLFIPLIITSTISFITIKYFEPHSIYSIRLAERGELITHHKDKAILTLMDMGKLIERDFSLIKPDDKLGELVYTISRSKRNIFPVVKDEMLIGILMLDDIRHLLFNTEMYDKIFVRDLMIMPPTHVSPDDSMNEAMKKFEELECWNLPVIKNGKYIGFLSKSKLFSVYRKWLLDISAEE